MSRIRRNIAANTLGRGWSMFLGVAILPLYVRFLGPEAYGLVGLYATISVICSLFDAGISASLGRELARASAEDDSGKQTAELVRTAEVLYVSIGIVLGGLVVFAAPIIVTRWLNLRDISPGEATQAVRLMGLFLAFQWATGLYLAGLSGLQRQVELNIISAVGTTIRAGGSVIVLWKVSASIAAFYWWQVVTTVAYLVASREALWRSPGVSRKQAAFKWTLVRSVRQFAAGVTLLSFLSVAASQLDKVVLTRLVSLESFGYYSFATSVAAAVTFFGQPVLAAIYPAMIQAFTVHDEVRLTSLFHRAAQLVSVAIFAPAAVLCAFAPVVLRVWARDPATTTNTSYLVSVCLVGAALNGAAVMPYNLTLAAGRVRPAMLAAGCGVIVYAAALAIFAPRLGVLAGAIGWVLVNLFLLLIYARFAIRPLLPGEARRWLVTDILLPLSVASIVAMSIRGIASSRTSLPMQLGGLLVASLATLVCTAVVTEAARHEMATRFRALFSGTS